MTHVRVLPNVIGLDKHFDYLVPERWAGSVAIGTIVRIDLHGRRVSGWVSEIDPADAFGGPAVKEIRAVTGCGPSAEILALAEWAARRWVGRRRHFLVAASPPRVVARVPSADRTGRAPGPSSPASSRLLADGGGVLRLPPTADPLPCVLSAVETGPTIVVAPGVDQAARLAARLRGVGCTVALVPEDWDTAAGGVDVVVGARTSAWAPCPDLAALVVLDEHDEALQDESSPTWHARDVVIERGRRAGVPVLLVSPSPTAVAVAWREPVRAPGSRERDGWPIVEVIDRRGEAPWKRSLLTSRLIEHLRDESRTVVCVSNTTGRARLLACRTCRELARCERCRAAVVLGDDQRLGCPVCATTRPAVCSNCGAAAFANLRPGVSRLREELEAAAGRPVVAVTGATETVDQAGVYVGTEAVLHRVASADTVAFLDFDRELLAPRYRASEQAMALLVRAARMAGPRVRGGRVLLQTFLPDHDVVRAAVLADPGRATATDLERRRLLALPPFGALAAVSGRGSDEFVAGLTGVDVGGAPGDHIVRAPDWERLSAALSGTPRPLGSRLRLAVDPPRA